ncbi:MAG: isochorismatase family cysteine hydrolase [Pseudomonadota bacterium]
MTRLAAAVDGQGGLTRNRPVDPARAALLFIDIQNFSLFPGRGEWSHVDPNNIPAELAYYFQRVNDLVLPNAARLRAAFRRAGAEVMYTVIECLTKDGRDRGLDYKITGFLVPKGSPDAQLPEQLPPGDDEIIIPKSTSSVFNSTNIDFLLRNLEIDYLVVAGLITDQCVESAVRDACDRGFLVTLVTDACATYSLERHEASLKALKGYCRQATTAELEAELDRLAHTAPPQGNI